MKHFLMMTSLCLLCAAARADVILSTDFTGRVVTGAKASGLKWTTHGVTDPGSLTASSPLFDTPATQDAFVADRNLHTEGHWQVDIPFEVDSQIIELTYLELAVSIFNDWGRNRRVSRDVDLEIGLFAQGTNMIASRKFPNLHPARGASIGPQVVRFDLRQTQLDRDTPYTISIVLFGQGPGNNAGIDDFSLEGRVLGPAARAPVTGQKDCWDSAGTSIPCAGTGQDGERRAGVAWPGPRFTDHGDGTVTDHLTGLIWLQRSDCFGPRDWPTALREARALADGSCGLRDGSSPGDWRLPQVLELQSLVAYPFSSPALSNAAGTAGGTNGDPFLSGRPADFWSSTTYHLSPSTAWFVNLQKIGTMKNKDKSNVAAVWPVRGRARSAPAPVPRTGQTTCWDTAGRVISCAGTGQDGACQAGVAWPSPRFQDNGDGTVSDELTGLIWLKNADCFGRRPWATALTDAGSLASGACGLSDGSKAGDWRLPQVLELRHLLDYGFSRPTLSDAAGSARWTAGNAFSNVVASRAEYWTSTSVAGSPADAWFVNLEMGNVNGSRKSGLDMYVWPVRDGK